MKRVPILVSFSLCLAASTTTLFAQDAIDFSRDILPIFSENCFTCHGPDAATREGGFRLDIRESALGEADSGEHPILPGDVDASEILRRMRAEDDSERMPPPQENKRPTAEQIRLVERWIAEGAAWKEHWAFVQPVRPELPAVRHGAWIRNGIDHFVLTRLESENLTPSDEANRTTLVRRLYLDLTGLPPSPRDVDAFLNDESPDAYEKLVDQLLGSPAYGEHMATFWLDAARFADTNGYQNDFRRSMWLWRDWVIKAYNDNMPYDQFAIEQLAGDMLPNATLEQKIASGFNRNHRSNTEGGSINEEWLVENVVDRVETTSTVFLGLTMGCARCHDHKYDPLSQREFYEFFSYFHNVDERGVYTEKRGNAGPVVSMPTQEQEHQLGEIANAIDLTREKHDVLKRVAEAEQPDWEAELLVAKPEKVSGHRVAFLSQTSESQPAKAESVESQLKQSDRFRDEAIGPTVEISGEEGSNVGLATVFDFDASKGFSVGVWVRPANYGAIISRMDAASAYRGFDMLLMPDGRLNVHLIHNWPRNATKITTVLPVSKDRWTHVAVTCESPGKAANIKVFLNGVQTEFTIDADTLNGSTLTDHPVWLGLRSHTPHYAGKISDLRLWDAALSPVSIQQLVNCGLYDLVASTREVRTDEQKADIKHLWVWIRTSASAAKIRKMEHELAELKKSFPTTMVMKELPEPRQTYVLKRGLYDQPDMEQPVSAAVPGLFHSDTSPKNRLELARWLVNGDNPLTARVAVNHYWARYFGTGLLETPENFGVQSPPPSHPELLDWLATEFVRTGWDIKAMQRLIVTSATYRQASSASPESFASDPKNRMLARGPRFRLPAEAIRDNALAVSGLLASRIGGPSVKPYQPEGLWEELAGGAGEPPYEQATNDDLYRRSLYIYRKRTVPHPTMTTFDGVGRDLCTVARDRTNTPLQALALLNDTTYVESAVFLAVRAIGSTKEHEKRLRLAFRCATARYPNQDELAVLKTAFKKYNTHFAEDPEAAKRMINVGNSKPDAELDPVELASYASVCSVILNLDEVVTKE